jgi:hypothetical protein
LCPNEVELAVHQLGGAGDRGGLRRSLDPLDEKRDKRNRKQSENEHLNDDLDEAEAGFVGVRAAVDASCHAPNLLPMRCCG